MVVLYEPGRAGAAALEVARELVERGCAELTVVAVAPQSRIRGGCCGGALPLAEYNRLVRQDTAQHLKEARGRLGAVGERAVFQLLVEDRDPALHRWIAGVADVAVVVLPARRRPLRAANHPAAARLRQVSSAKVLIVEDAQRDGVQRLALPDPSA
ncbi:MAG TPA: hypothetical protein VKV27_04150 [Solirubrobacteraceae bacterium]|nr:hypothetical protein [Solirubrobacteraceae bacterium]